MYCIWMLSCRSPLNYEWWNAGIQWTKSTHTCRCRVQFLWGPIGGRPEQPGTQSCQCTESLLPLVFVDQVELAWSAILYSTGQSVFSRYLNAFVHYLVLYHGWERLSLWRLPPGRRVLQTQRGKQSCPIEQRDLCHHSPVLSFLLASDLDLERFWLVVLRETEEEQCHLPWGSLFSWAVFLHFVGP